MSTARTPENLVIVGTGCAGLTSAIYAARANLCPLVLQGAQPGGQLTTTSEVENYPGFEHGINGPELMEVTQKQAARFGSELVYDTVTAVDLDQHPFRLRLESDAELTADTVI